MASHDTIKNQCYQCYILIKSHNDPAHICGLSYKRDSVEALVYSSLAAD